MDDIKVLWGKYSKFEGPFYPGIINYNLPKNSTLEDKTIKIVSATEGRFDSINMYDKCIISVGLIQFCEANYYLVTKLFSEFCKKYGTNILDTSLTEIKQLIGYNPWFKDSDNEFRFHTKNGDKIDSLKEQQDLFLGCSGEIGSWNEQAIQKAKLWAKCVAKFLQSKEMTVFQIEYLKKFIKQNYTSKFLNETLEKNKNTEFKDLSEAIYLSYISFASNNPKNAKENLEITKNKNSNVLTKEFLVDMLRQMTFANSITIYKKRYEKIARELNLMYPSLSLPNTSDILSTTGSVKYWK